MTPSQLQRIEAIFHSALDCEPGNLSSFLDRACADDALLRRRVEALLGADQQVDDFIETLPGALAARVVANENDTNAALIGRTISHYRVIDYLDRGGMGEVYLATDTRANRKAVLKVLPAGFTADPDRIRQFQREARAVIALNHPNIVTVYEIGEEDGIYYIISELIEGETLEWQLSRGRMELEKVTEVAMQVASALSAAHKTGVVHRDVKPGNIMLRDDGYIKVLDFGIAKLAQPGPELSSPDEQMIANEHTICGSTMGTLRYMSPEQLRGEPVDERSDIWSLGVVIYEMLTGVPPFDGKNRNETSNLIRKVQLASLSAAVGRIPPELERIVSKALEKKRDNRFARMSDLLEALRQVRRKLEREAESTNNLWLLIKALLAIGAVVLIVGAAAVLLLLDNDGLTTRMLGRPVTRFTGIDRGAKANGKFSAILPLASRQQTESGQLRSYGVNLLKNGGAEDGAASATGLTVTVPGWTTTGGFMVVPYGAPGGFPTLEQAPPNGGKQFFAGGNSDLSTATQEIDISANGAKIDSGRVSCEISVWLGGYSDQNDDATFTVSFRSNAATELKAITLPSVTALERLNQTGFKFRTSSVMIPPQTRRIHAMLLLTRRTNAGPFNDGYADNLSITLHGPVPVAQTESNPKACSQLELLKFWGSLLGGTQIVLSRNRRG